MRTLLEVYVKNNIPHKITFANLMATISLCFWVVSLLFVAVTTYNPGRNLTGLDILLTGWQGIFGFNIAWFSNVTYLVSAWLFYTNKNPIKLSVISIILALNTITLERVAGSGAGMGEPIYGYGIGFFLWFMAILLLFSAVYIEYKNDIGVKISTVCVSLFPFVVFVVFVGHMSVSDHLNAGNDEIVKLDKSLFKRRVICTEDISFPSRVLPDNTPLEITNIGMPSFFDDPYRLLRAGVFSIRIDGVEYSMRSGNTKDIKESNYSSDASANLIVNINYREYRITLIDPDGETIIFDQVWRHINDFDSCPSYHPTGKSYEQPQKIILESLGIIK